VRGPAALGLALALVAAAASGAAGQGPGGRSPVLTIAVSCRGLLRTAAGGPVRVSNLGPIALEIGMHYFEVPPDQTSPGPLDLILVGHGGVPGARPPNLEVRLVALAGGARAPVAARVQPSGVSGGTEHRDRLPGARFLKAVSAWLTIPLSEAAQRASVEALVEALRRAGRPEEAGRVEQLVAASPALREQLVQEHEPGAYEIVARYRPRRGDYWPTELTSASLTLEVVHKGSSLDPLVGRPAAPVGCE